jgi:hypothetical protein
MYGFEHSRVNEMNKVFFDPQRFRLRLGNILLCAALSWTLIIAAPILCLGGNDPNQTPPYKHLIEFIQAASMEKPLYAFDTFKSKLDPAVHQSNLAYFMDHPDLLNKVKLELNTQAPSWRLENSKQRLVFVPEKRTGYATVFKSYCTDAVNFVLQQTQLQNPFNEFTTLNYEFPKLSETKRGITAYLVHNLAVESLYTYGFYNPQEKKVLIELGQKVYVGEIGSYSSWLAQNTDGSFTFIQNSYTIWQNSANNPYSVLMTPAEETFHITLREHTERAIVERLQLTPTNEVAEINHIVNEWIAVEEAIAGGLVYNLLPDFLSKSFKEFNPAWIESDLATKMTMKRYKYLHKGIHVVENLGTKKSIQLYCANPHAFRDLII